MARQRRMMRPETALRSVLVALMAILLPVSLAAQFDSPTRGLLGDGPLTPRIPLPKLSEIEDARSQNLKALWNARGNVNARIGHEHELAIRADAEPGLQLHIERQGRRVVVRAGTDMYTEGELSIELELSRDHDGWRIENALVKVDGIDYAFRRGTITVDQFDEHRGIFEATFDLDVYIGGRQPVDLQIRNGRLSLRQSR